MLRPVIRGSATLFFAGAVAMLITPINVAQSAGEQDRQDLARKASASLKWMAQDLRARSLNGGYADSYPPLSTPGDLQTIHIQYPGTPDVGQCLLRAHKVLDNREFLVAATEVGRALAWYQSKTGGWPIEIEAPSTPPETDEGMALIQRQNRDDTLDDNTTQGALDFLLDLDEKVDAPWLEETLDLGLNFLLESQLEAGGWPQYYPLIGGYHDFYTFNDGATNNAIDVMLKAHARSGDSRYLESALLGSAFIAASQLPAPQSGWAQQYDLDLKPAPARAFEPAAVSSSSTSRNILTLLDVAEYTEDLHHLEPIPAAIKWLEMSALGEEEWARFYELETNRPIYPSRSGKIVGSIDALPEGESKKYAYVAGFRAKEAMALYRMLTEDENGHGNNFGTWRDEVSRVESKRKARKSERHIAEVLAYAEPYQEKRAGGEIQLGDFTAMCETILNYLEFNALQ